MFVAHVDEKMGKTLQKRNADPADPLCSNAQGWWFWDEVWVGLHGPYTSEAEAAAACTAYAKTL